jgi:hypothetical protein
VTTVTIPVDAAVEALFASALQPSASPDRTAVREVVVDAVHQAADCAGLVAQEFGDHPAAAAERMCWCRAAVAAAFDLEQDCS